MEAFARRWLTQAQSILLWPLRYVLSSFLHHVLELRDFAFLHFPRMLQAPDIPMESDTLLESQSWRMKHLKTKEECRLKNDLIEVWTVEMPSKHAEGILKVIKDHLDGRDNSDLQHLRRFAKPKYLPPHVLNQDNAIKQLYTLSLGWDDAPTTVIQPDLSGIWQWPTSTTSRPPRPPNLYLLICPSSAITLQDMQSLLLEHTPFASSSESWAYPLEIKAVKVPRLPPTSPEQAAEWSERYWPTFYRKTNPFGAHPVTIQKAEEELEQPDEDNIGIEDAMSLAEQAADDSATFGIGIPTGCCIVERVDGKTEVIAVAGDGRYSTLRPDERGLSEDICQGNVMAHSVMRAIGMVGRKRLRVASHVQKKSAAKAESNFDRVGMIHDEKARDAFFLDLPVTGLEEDYFMRDNIKPDGYLCLKLEIFLTHEPCVMCCMALVHSRVGKVIFKERMPTTGGLTAEIDSNATGPIGLGYGLCWRKELNWQFMCWEYRPEKEDKENGQIYGETEVVIRRPTSDASTTCLNPITSVPTFRKGRDEQVETNPSIVIRSLQHFHV